MALRDRRPACDLNDAELLELYGLERQFARNAYGRLVAVLSTFPPYLDARPYLIGPFVEGLYEAAQGVFRGVQGRAELLEFIESKSQVDDDLRAAFTHHRAVFDQVLSSKS